MFLALPQNSQMHVLQKESLRYGSTASFIQVTILKLLRAKDQMASRNFFVHTHTHTHTHTDYYNPPPLSGRCISSLLIDFIFN